MACVLDACAMIAFLRGEEGADAVTSLLLAILTGSASG